MVKVFVSDPDLQIWAFVGLGALAMGLILIARRVLNSRE